MHVLAHWGARSLGPPQSEGDLEPGWLAGALEMALPPTPPATSIEFRVGDEVAALVDGEPRQGAADEPDAVVVTDAAGFYHLVVERDFTGISIVGDERVVRALIEALPYSEPVATPA
jgi:hypothetical protein